MNDKLAADSGAERAARRISQFIGKGSICTETLNIQQSALEVEMADIIREETGTQWISVGERLPKGRPVLTYTPEAEGMRLILQYYEGRWWYPLSDQQVRWNISHWMPLPAAPDEGGKR